MSVFLLLGPLARNFTFRLLPSKTVHLMNMPIEPVADGVEQLNNGPTISAQRMETRQQLNCVVCRGTGEPLYQGLTDRLFGAPGEWSLRRCADKGCGLIWLDPAPLKASMYIDYQNYYTHTEVERDSSLRRLYRRV